MPRPAGMSIVLSEDAKNRLKEQEDIIVQSILDDMQSENWQARARARELALELGLMQPSAESKGVVPFLLEQARKGAFGEYVKALQEQEKALDPVLKLQEIEFQNQEAVPEALFLDNNLKPEIKDPLAEAIKRSKKDLAPEFVKEFLNEDDFDDTDLF